VGRIWDFLTQDANAAMDRVMKPYADFVLSHPLVMHVTYGAMVAVVWIVLSRILALLLIALWVVPTLIGFAAVLWRKRGG
jgi:hypothetical protein